MWHDFFQMGYQGDAGKIRRQPVKYFWPASFPAIGIGLKFGAYSCFGFSSREKRKKSAVEAGFFFDHSVCWHHNCIINITKYWREEATVLVATELIDILQEAAKRIQTAEMEPDDKAALIILLLSFLSDIPIKD
jgi:hypothetical protein